jgi:IS605 OrfB family transposase
MAITPLRPIAPPFVVAAAKGARVRTRLHVSPEDVAVLVALGTHLGSLAGTDLATRASEGRLDAAGAAASRRQPKQALTGACSSRWAGAITRTSEDSYQLAWRNLVAEAASLGARAKAIRRRLAIGVGDRSGPGRGYASQAERFDKQRRLQVIEARRAAVSCELASGRVSICRGGARLAHLRHHLDQAGVEVGRWRARWQASRAFITADGEADKRWGNETIRWHPEEHWVEIKLPTGLAHMANAAHGRYRLVAPVVFSYRGDEVAAQAASGAIRYDVFLDADRSRWYMDASWKMAPGPAPVLDELRAHRVLGVDLNAGHLAALVVDPSGNPVGDPASVPLELAGLAASTRDGRLRQAISALISLAKASDCAAIVIEDLDFAEARQEGREHTGTRPSRGRAGRAFRRQLAGIPTARFRDRLVGMATNAGVGVIAVDPAYTSRWGTQHWLGALQQICPDASGHHAAALVIGRRGLAQRARRRERCDCARPEDRPQRATDSAVGAMPGHTGLCDSRTREPGHDEARGQPDQWRKTQPADSHLRSTRTPKTVRGAPRSTVPSATS